jgi:hypothetical protein
MHQKGLNEIHGHDILKIWNVIDHDQQINMKVAGIHDPISQPGECLSSRKEGFSGPGLLGPFLLCGDKLSFA